MRLESASLREMAIGFLVLLALLLPMLPLAQDGTARMRVHFRTTEMAKPRAFTAEAPLGVCAAMAAALTYENPDTGEFTRVACGE